MKFSNLATNPDFLMRLLFVSGALILFVSLLPHDPSTACMGLLMMGMPAFHWYVASQHSYKLGRYRKPALTAAYVGMWAGILVGIGWAGRGLITAFG